MELTKDIVENVFRDAQAVRNCSQHASQKGIQNTFETKKKKQEQKQKNQPTTTQFFKKDEDLKRTLYKRRCTSGG